jgi:uncharacterized protein (DUF433 family)
MAIQGVIHGNTIELNESPGLRDGEAVTVTIERAAAVQAPGDEASHPKVEDWVERLVFDPAVLLGERIVKGTTLSAEALVTEISNGRSDRELLEQHAELTPSDLSALRSYAQLPQPFRLTFGAWAEDGGELDEYLELLRRRRRLGRREIAP